MPPLSSISRLFKSAAFIPVVLTVLVIIHVAIVASTILEDRSIIWPMHNDTIHRVGRGVDFYAVYHAGINVSDGISPYENNKDGITPYWCPFRYLPVVAWVAQSFTLLTPRAAYLVWVLILEVCLALLLFVLWRIMSHKAYRIATVSLLLVNSTYFLELHVGQFTFISLTLCSLALILPAAGPLLFTLSVLIKPLSLAILPAMARERIYRFTWIFAIVCLLLVSVPYFVQEPAQWNIFFEANFIPRGGFHAGNFGFVYLLHLLAEDGDITLLMQHWDTSIGVFRLVLLISTALLVFHSRSSTVREGVSALLLAHFLTYQHVWEHQMSGVCVVAALLMTVPGCRNLRYIAVLICLLVLVMPSPSGLMDVAKDPSVWDPSSHWPRIASYITILSKVLPTVALYLISMLSVLRDGLGTPREAIYAALTKPSDRHPERCG